MSGNSSTSAPAISASGKIYVGFYNGFTAGGIDIINQSAFTKAYTITDLGPIQASVIVYYDAARSLDYLYYATNAQQSAGYCYCVDLSDYDESDFVWQTPTGYYSLQGMAACNGYLVFGNDADMIYIIH